MLDQIEEDLERAIERAVYFSKFFAINKTFDFAGLWDIYNKMVKELNRIDPDFFQTLEPLDFPKPRKMKFFMRVQYYGQYFGEHTLPLLAALRNAKVLVQDYKRNL
ncbi:MAG: hypothetical protein M3O71_11990 [Bacteroidota bacterium]|nr:hypothetical protein [Bacteroidota bacterium]